MINLIYFSPVYNWMSRNVFFVLIKLFRQVQLICFLLILCALRIANRRFFTKRFMLRQLALENVGDTEWHKKTGTFEKSNKNGRNPRKKFIDRNWTITTCLLRDSNPYYLCLKITSCRWRPPPRVHSFIATTHFKSSRSFVSPCVCSISVNNYFSWIS